MGTEYTQWPVQVAKAQFSELLNTCLVEGPQMISRRGVLEAVLVPLEQWKLITAQQTSLKELLQADTGRFIIDVPQRGHGRHREIDEG